MRLRPRLVWSTTPVALITGRSEKRPPWRARSTTRAASTSTVAGDVPAARARARCSSSAWRTRAVRRAQVIPWSSLRSATRRSRASTEGRPRSVAARSTLTERRLDFLSHAGDDLLRLVPPRLGCPFRVARLAPAAYGVLREPGPQLIEVRVREPLPPKRVGPLGGEILDEPVPLRGEAARFPDEVGQPRRHALLLDQVAHGIEQVRLEPSGRRALIDGRRAQLAAPPLTMHVCAHLRVQLDSRVGAVRLREHR